MPREQINTPRHRFVSPIRNPEDGPDGPITGYGYRYPLDGEGLVDGEAWEFTPALHIGWHGDGSGAQQNGDPNDSHLDVFVEIHADEILRIADGIRWVRENLTPAPAAMHRIEITSLTRPETQKLIRVLKRARDAVFGADE